MRSEAQYLVCGVTQIITIDTHQVFVSCYLVLQAASIPFIICRMMPSISSFQRTTSLSGRDRWTRLWSTTPVQLHHTASRLFKGLCLGLFGCAELYTDISDRCCGRETLMVLHHAVLPLISLNINILCS